MKYWFQWQTIAREESLFIVYMRAKQRKYIIHYKIRYVKRGCENESKEIPSPCMIELPHQTCLQDRARIWIHNPRASWVRGHAFWNLQCPSRNYGQIHKFGNTRKKYMEFAQLLSRSSNSSNSIQLIMFSLNFVSN